MDSNRRDEPDDRRGEGRFEQQPRELTTSSLRRHTDEPVTDEGASSTLFVGNLSGNVRYKDLMNLFKKYGDIEVIKCAIQYVFVLLDCTVFWRGRPLMSVDSTFFDSGHFLTVDIQIQKYLTSGAWKLEVQLGLFFCNNIPI